MSDSSPPPADKPAPFAHEEQAPPPQPATAAPPSNTASAEEVGGRAGPEPTRYGDWERKGICVDF